MADTSESPQGLPSDQDLFSSATALSETAPQETSPSVEPPEPVSPPVPPPVPSVAPEVEAPIPSWRLREEAEGRRMAEDRARALEVRLTEIATHLQQNQKQPDFFENPDQATQALILRTLQPYAEETRKQMMAMGKMVASAAHGADKVNTAERAFLEARQRETLDPMDYERVVQAPNRYDAVVQWHKRQNVLTSVGEDPDAWWEKKLEERMADPQFQAKLLERVRGSAAKRPSETRIPPSLSRTTASASNGAGDQLGDMGDRSLFEYAMRGGPHRG